MLLHFKVLKSKDWEVVGSDVKITDDKYKDVSKFKISKPTVLLLG